MGVLRPLALVLVASGCTEVVLDPFDVETAPPTPLNDLGINVVNVFVPEGEMHMIVPTEGLCGVERIRMTGNVPFYFYDAVEPDVTQLWVAVYIELDGLPGCSERDLSEFNLLTLTQPFPEAELTQGEVVLEGTGMDPIGSGECSFFGSDCVPTQP